jgi:hypothetical protein
MDPTRNTREVRIVIRQGARSIITPCYPPAEEPKRTQIVPIYPPAEELSGSDEMIHTTRQ